MTALAAAVAAELTDAGYTVTAVDDGGITSDAEPGMVFVVVQDCRRRLGMPTYPSYVAWRAGRL